VCCSCVLRPIVLLPPPAVLLHAIRVLVHSAGLSWHGPVIPLLSPAFSNEFGVLVSFCSQDTTGWGCDGHCQVQHAHRVCMCLFPYNRRFVLQILSAGMDGHHKHDNRHVALQRVSSIRGKLLVFFLNCGALAELMITIYEWCPEQVIHPYVRYSCFQGIMYKTIPHPKPCTPSADDTRCGPIPHVITNLQWAPGTDAQTQHTVWLIQWIRAARAAIGRCRALLYEGLHVG
jgi:hypothetical protein